MVAEQAQRSNASKLETVLAKSWRYDQNSSKLTPVESVREVVVCTGGVACVGDGTSLRRNPCWLVESSRLRGTLFPTPEDDRRCYESAASAVHGYAGGVGQAERGTVE